MRSAFIQGSSSISTILLIYNERVNGASVRVEFLKEVP